MDVDKILNELTLDEKALLTAGADMWSTPGIDRLDLPPVRVTDGPNGARGSSLLGVGDATAVCVPCGSALGATFNPALIERVGHMLGQEARTKACRVLLAPTINLHRSPTGGRNFECYSEDPLLSGKIAAAFVRGVQAEGVATTAKHFVANDAEFERNTIDSVVDERTLREIYLVPFEIAVKEGGALGIMTAYNRLNGAFCAENGWLLGQVLRQEWGFEGFVVTDWFSIGSTKESAEAGLDLQMPGPGRYFGPALADAVRAGEVAEATLDAQVARMLRVWERMGALADSPDEPEQSIDRPEHRTLAREAAAESIVLLRNDGTLPLDRGALRKLAVIGPNADRSQIMGGGSASLRAHYLVTPLEALREAVGANVEIVHERGCWTEKTVPPLSPKGLGDAGIAVDFFASTDWTGDVVHSSVNPNGQVLIFGSPGEGVPAEFSFRASGEFTPEESGLHTFTMIQAGHARVSVDGELVLDGISSPPGPGTAFFGMGSREMEAELELDAGRPVRVEVEYTTGGAPLLKGVVVGHRPPIAADGIERAVAAARDADAAVLVVGTNGDWESEGHDRESMALPGEQDELIRRVCAANPRTVVCINAGSPVEMDWADDPAAPAAVLQTWFGGQEMAGALADVLLGDSEPAGRLPTTFPIRESHGPAFGNFPGENSELRYGEGLLVGYRWYESRELPVRFAFGHGLSYSRFDIGEPALSSQSFGPGADGEIRVGVTVTNRGERRGCEVVQCYVAPPDSRLFRSARELRAFEKVWLDPGESRTVTLVLGARAFAYWNPGDPNYEAVRDRLGPMAAMVGQSGGAAHLEAPGWYIDEGSYQLQIGRSSAETAQVCQVDVAEPIGPIAP